jgi:hypothetical protein
MRNYIQISAKIKVKSQNTVIKIFDGNSARREQNSLNEKQVDYSGYYLWTAGCNLQANMKIIIDLYSNE